MPPARDGDCLIKVDSVTLLVCIESSTLMLEDTVLNPAIDASSKRSAEAGEKDEEAGTKAIVVMKAGASTNPSDIARPVQCLTVITTARYIH